MEHLYPPGPSSNFELAVDLELGWFNLESSLWYLETWVDLCMRCAYSCGTGNMSVDCDLTPTAATQLQWAESIVRCSNTNLSYSLYRQLVKSGWLTSTCFHGFICSATMVPITDISSWNKDKIRPTTGIGDWQSIIQVVIDRFIPGHK